MAEILAGEPAPEHSERLAGWSPEVGMLAQIIDRLGSVMNAVVMSNGGKQLDIAPVPRPVTAIQRARERRHRESHEAFVRRMVAPDHHDERLEG